jgi:uncharacterized protein (DUF433 family)
VRAAPPPSADTWPITGPGREQRHVGHTISTDTRRYRSMSDKALVLGRFVVIDPAICHGKPTFRGTRIMVADILDEVAHGFAWETIEENWGGRVTKAAIAEAVALANEAFLDRATHLRKELMAEPLGA